MRKFTRSEAPEVLAQNWEEWGRSWEQRHTADAGATFHWHSWNNQNVNDIILPFLKAQTQDHCSFCDAFPVSPPSDDTIEHFRPKSRFHRIAYKWENLYYCCRCCQGKSDSFEEGLLAPDAKDYSFDRYFRWDYTRGTLEVIETASPEDQLRARITIQMYDLNEKHPRFRLLERRKREQAQLMPLDLFAYRDFIS